MLDYKKSGRVPIAWITRGGKHIPIFDKDNEEKKILDELPTVDIGQIKPEEKKILTRLVRQGKVKKVKWYWNNMSIGPKKTWYFRTDQEVSF